MNDDIILETRALTKDFKGFVAVSEVNLNLANFQTAIRNVISGGTTGGVSFVTSAQQAYGRWSDDGLICWALMDHSQWRAGHMPVIIMEVKDGQGKAAQAVSSSRELVR